MPQPTKFTCCLAASSVLSLCGPSRQDPTGYGCMREKTTKASRWSWVRNAPASRTASIWVKSAPSTCWRAAGSSTRCPITEGGSTCWGPKSTGTTRTGEPRMLRLALCGGWWICTKIVHTTIFSIWNLIKYLVCIVGNCWLLVLCANYNSPVNAPW